MDSALNFLKECVKIFVRKHLKRLHLYARYVDDIFLICDDNSKLISLKNTLESHSVLRFTYQLADINKQLPFLDITVSQLEDRLKLGMYSKPESTGATINADGFCPEKYKLNVINNYLHRAYKITNDWDEFHTEVDRIKNVLINNNFSNRMVDDGIRSFLDRKFAASAASDAAPASDAVRRSGVAGDGSTISLFYQSQMHHNYKIDEKILVSMINNNVFVANPDRYQLKLQIYYKCKRAHQLVAVKSSVAGSDHNKNLKRTNVVYEFRCPFCRPLQTYIGHTRTTLARRLTMHIQGGSIRTHLRNIHKIDPTRSLLDSNTRILSFNSDPIRLKIQEALFIQQMRPAINVQDDTFQHTLQLFGRTDNFDSCPTSCDGLPRRGDELTSRSVRGAPRGPLADGRLSRRDSCRDISGNNRLQSKTGYRSEPKSVCSPVTSTLPDAARSTFGDGRGHRDTCHVIDPNTAGVRSLPSGVSLPDGSSVAGVSQLNRDSHLPFHEDGVVHPSVGADGLAVIGSGATSGIATSGFTHLTECGNITVRRRR